MQFNFEYLILYGLIGLATLLVAEFGYKRGWWRGEGARKFVHMAVGVQVATWPLNLDWNEIRLISILLTVGFVISMRLKWFQSIGSIARLSYGEVLYTLIIGALTLLTESPAVYAAAVLHLSLADGLAALMGLRYGRTTTYRVFSSTKSLVGTLTFMAVSVIILSLFSLITPSGLDWQWIVIGALGAAFLENTGVLGLDNITVPAFIVLLLTLVR